MQAPPDTMELRFPASGAAAEGQPPSGYAVYAALCAHWSALHDASAVLVGRVRRGVLPIRLPVALLDSALALSQTTLVVQGRLLRLDVPTLDALRPAPALTSPFVTIHRTEGGKRRAHDTPRAFEVALRRALAALGFDPAPVVVVVGRRAEVSVRRFTQVGFAVELYGLDPALALAIQAQGLGGRRHFGAGWFEPLRPQEGAWAAP